MTKYKFEDVATVVTAQIHLVPDGFPKKMSRYYKYCNKNNILMPFLPTDIERIKGEVQWPRQADCRPSNGLMPPKFHNSLLNPEHKFVAAITQKMIITESHINKSNQGINI